MNKKTKRQETLLESLEGLRKTVPSLWLIDDPLGELDRIRHGDKESDRCLCGGRGCNSCEPQGRG